MLAHLIAKLVDDEERCSHPVDQPTAQRQCGGPIAGAVNDRATSMLEIAAVARSIRRQIDFQHPVDPLWTQDLTNAVGNRFLPVVDDVSGSSFQGLSSLD